MHVWKCFVFLKSKEEYHSMACENYMKFTCWFYWNLATLTAACTAWWLPRLHTALQAGAGDGD